MLEHEAKQHGVKGDWIEGRDVLAAMRALWCRTKPTMQKNVRNMRRQASETDSIGDVTSAMDGGQAVKRHIILMLSATLNRPLTAPLCCRIRPDRRSCGRERTATRRLVKGNVGRVRGVVCRAMPLKIGSLDVEGSTLVGTLILDFAINWGAWIIASIFQA